MRVASMQINLMRHETLFPSPPLPFNRITDAISVVTAGSEETEVKAHTQSFPSPFYLTGKWICGWFHQMYQLRRKGLVWILETRNGGFIPSVVSLCTRGTASKYKSKRYAWKGAESRRGTNLPTPASIDLHHVSFSPSVWLHDARLGIWFLIVTRNPP